MESWKIGKLSLIYDNFFHPRKGGIFSYLRDSTFHPSIFPKLEMKSYFLIINILQFILSRTEVNR
jgi:hypothetical protein